jgi:anti-sigma-K factor RskA
MNQPHEWFVENREAFVARHLEADEERAFRDHLARCAECRDAIAAIERELSWLSMGVAPVPPRPGLVRALTRGVLREEAPRWRRWAPLATAALLTLAALGWGVSSNRQRRGAEARLHRAADELAAARDTLSVLRNAARVLHASVSMGEHQGALIIFADPVSHRWKVVLSGLPPAPPGERYQFWFICDDGMVRGAEIKPAGTSPGILTLGMPSEGGAVLGASLTMEPMDATTGPPRGKELAHLML